MQIYVIRKQIAKVLFCAIGTVLLLCVSVRSRAALFENAHYTLCFTPQDNCTRLIVQTLGQAKHTIYVQAYLFTSRSIARALILAKQRGVLVQVLADKSQMDPRYFSQVHYLHKAGVPIWIDNRVAISHNKVMIVDGHYVLTGSFNFTRAAQTKNAENLLLIDDVPLAKRYLKNWQYRKRNAVPMESYKYAVSDA